VSDAIFSCSRCRKPIKLKKTNIPIWDAERRKRIDARTTSMSILAEECIHEAYELTNGYGMRYGDYRINGELCAECMESFKEWFNEPLKDKGG